ncbi:MAG: hypothetical protein PVI90_06430 [Desulfobacteraceae bacterium]
MSWSVYPKIVTNCHESKAVKNLACGDELGEVSDRHPADAIGLVGVGWGTDVDGVVG